MQHAVRGICTPTARLATIVLNWQAANSLLGFCSGCFAGNCCEKNGIIQLWVLFVKTYAVGIAKHL